MEEKEFFELVKGADEIYHVRVSPPDYDGGSMELEFLDGKLKGAIANVEAWDFREKR